MAQQTKSIVSYRVRQGDGLERLALRFLGDAEQWLQLAILNGLDYPYISDDAAFVKEVPAAGTVTFARTAGSTGSITIPSGYVVSVPASGSFTQKDYRTTGTTTLPNGTDTVNAAVAAVLPGTIGNTPGLTVTLLASAIANLASVSNAAAITGGESLNVKLPGDTLLVYSDAGGLADTVGVDVAALRGEDFFAALLGVDLALTADGDLSADSRGGLALISGIDNFRQALLRRFGTPLAWYVFNPAYGSLVEQAIGQRGDSFWLQRVRLDVERTVRGDPRTQDVQNIRVAFAGGALTISLDILTIGEKTPNNLVITYRVPGG